jgi:hypothetical protein
MANLEKYTGGTTTLATYAILKAGVPKRHEAIQLSLDYLSSNPPIYIYDAALRVQLLTTLDPVLYQQRIQRAAKLLLEFPLNYYSYGVDYDRGATGDLSNHQFALVGLEALDRHGFPVATKFWQQSSKYLRRTQHKDGTWGYYPRQDSTPTMILSGIVSLACCHRALERKNYSSSKLADLEADIAQALAQAASNWLLDQEDSRAPLNRWLLYGCYSLERAMALTGTRKLGEHDWYPEIARHLLQLQRQNGSWSSRKGENEMNTAFALLTLARATAQVGTTGVSSMHSWDQRWQSADPNALLNITATGAPDCQVFLSAMADDELVLITHDNELRPRIRKVRWLLDQELVAELNFSEQESIEMARSPTAPRFAAKFKLPSNGQYQLVARLQYAQTKQNLGVATQLEWLESAPLEIHVQGIVGKRAQLQMKLRERHALKGRPEDQKLELEASSSIGGAEGMRRALDRCQATAWRWKAGDSKRRWAVKFDIPFRATALRLLPALPPDQSTQTYQNPVLVEIKINGSYKKTLTIRQDQLRPGIILDFSKRIKIRKFELEVLEVESTQKANIGGFREIEFLLE